MHCSGSCWGKNTNVEGVWLGYGERPSFSHEEILRSTSLTSEGYTVAYPHCIRCGQRAADLNRGYSQGTEGIFQGHPQSHQDNSAVKALQGWNSATSSLRALDVSGLSWFDMILLKKRVSLFVEPQTEEEQSGFCPGHGTLDQPYTLARRVYGRGMAVCSTSPHVQYQAKKRLIMPWGTQREELVEYWVDGLLPWIILPL